MLSFFGIILFMFAGIDAVLLLFGWSLTGYSWSPLIVAVLGFALVTLEALERESSPERNGAWPQEARTAPGPTSGPGRNRLVRSTEG